MTILMLDSVDARSFPSSGYLAGAGYVNGRWPSFNAIRARFPHLPALSITVNASGDAQCLDVEAGDATPAQVPGWFDRQHALHPARTPVLYCSASTTSAVRAAAGSRHYLLWSAHYGKGPHICSPSVCGYPQADATQWTNIGPHGENVDQSLLSTAFFYSFAPRPVLPPSAPVLSIGKHDPVSSAYPHAVAHLQAGLKHEFPLYAGALSVDGDFGSHTSDAVYQFQVRSHIKADRIVGPQTWGLLAHFGIKP